MKFQHVGRLVTSIEFLQSVIANVQMQQAYADLLSPFIVIEARVNMIENTLEQVLFDPSGLRLPRISEGELIPRLNATLVKHQAMSIHENPFTASIKVIPA